MTDSNGDQFARLTELTAIGLDFSAEAGRQNDIRNQLRGQRNRHEIGTGPWEAAQQRVEAREQRIAQLQRDWGNVSDARRDEVMRLAREGVPLDAVSRHLDRVDPSRPGSPGTAEARDKEAE
jgi:hypothetical protein